MTVEQNLSDGELRATLEWYQAIGVDLAVGETPIDQFALSAMPAKKTGGSAAPPPVQLIKRPANPNATPAQAKAPIETPATKVDPEAAKRLAASAQSLEALEAVLLEYEGCTLKLRATQLVFADGAADADVMIIGEAPSRDDDLQGKAFSGNDGVLLDKMLTAIGLDRTQVYLSNIVPWRPPGSRAPTPTEISSCLPFLHRQIELVAPKFIVMLGAPAAQTMFETKISIARLRGQWRELEIGGTAFKAMASLPPSFLLRQPAQKQLAWQDMLMLKQAIDLG